VIDNAAFMALQQFRKFTWVLVVGCSATLLAASILWLILPRLRREHAIACLGIGCIGVFLGVELSVAWDNSSLAYWAAYTVGHAVLAATLLLVTAISIIGMWRR